MFKNVKMNYVNERMVITNHRFDSKFYTGQLDNLEVTLSVEPFLDRLPSDEELENYTHVKAPVLYIQDDNDNEFTIYMGKSEKLNLEFRTRNCTIKYPQKSIIKRTKYNKDLDVKINIDEYDKIKTYVNTYEDGAITTVIYYYKDDRIIKEECIYDEPEYKRSNFAYQHIKRSNLYNNLGKLVRTYISNEISSKLEKLVDYFECDFEESRFKSLIKEFLERCELKYDFDIIKEIMITIDSFQESINEDDIYYALDNMINKLKK